MFLESGVLLSLFVLCVPGQRVTPGSNYTYISPSNGLEYTSYMRPLTSLNIKELRENGPELGLDDEFLSRECTKSPAHCMIEMRLSIRELGDDDENVGFDLSRPLGSRRVSGFKLSEFRTYEKLAFEEEARQRKEENDRNLAFAIDAINKGLGAANNAKKSVAYTVTVLFAVIGSIAGVCVCVAVSVGCYIGCSSASSESNEDPRGSRETENVLLNEMVIFFLLG
eukprot:TRINITY_DN18866_c0_g1_i1.p1 TRINITY_DN18866_c0_g1~~TRINITY_DN18866_c0_g1_i1.p1  ORF type:complete len:225 (-),score=67.57 TRINITY_DN18866_c0_g1_i1:42-716(-)